MTMPKSHRAVFMARALELAQKCLLSGDVPIGAVVVSNGKIIGEGYNTRQRDSDISGHAEVIAMKMAAETLGTWKLEGCDLYVTLEPCIMCAGAIVSARIETLIYGAADEKAGGVRSLYAICEDPRLNHRVKVLTGIKSGECSELITGFFRNIRELKSS